MKNESFVRCPDWIREAQWIGNAVLVYFSILFASYFVLESAAHRGVMYIGIPLLLCYIVRERDAFSVHKLVGYLAVGFIGYFVINYASILWSEPQDAEKLFQRLKMLFLFPVVLFGFAVAYAKNPKIWRWCLAAFVAASILSALALVLLKYELILSHGRLPSWGRGENPVQCGLLYGLAFLILVFCREKLPYFNKLPCLAIYALSLFPLAILILSQSRGPFASTVVVAVGMMLLGVIVKRKVPVKKFALMLVLLATTAGAFLHYGQAVTIERGTTGRLQIWEKSIELIKEKPVMGHGIATKFRYPFDHNGKRKLSGHPHSIYLSALVHTGIIGLLFQLAAMVGGLYLALQKYRQEQDSSFLILIGFGALLGFVDFGGYYTNLGTTWLVFWFPLSLLLFRRAEPLEQTQP